MIFICNNTDEDLPFQLHPGAYAVDIFEIEGPGLARTIETVVHNPFFGTIRCKERFAVECCPFDYRADTIEPRIILKNDVQYGLVFRDFTSRDIVGNYVFDQQRVAADSDINPQGILKEVDMRLWWGGCTHFVMISKIQSQQWLCSPLSFLMRIFGSEN